MYIEFDFIYFFVMEEGGNKSRGVPTQQELDANRKKMDWIRTIINFIFEDDLKKDALIKIYECSHG